MSGAEMIAAERKRQIEDKGWSLEWDEQHGDGSLAVASACYAVSSVDDGSSPRLSVVRSHVAYDGLPSIVDAWPWLRGHDKRGRHNRIKKLAIAGALIAAEIDRIHRQEAEDKSEGGAR